MTRLTLFTVLIFILAALLAAESSVAGASDTTTLPIRSVTVIANTIGGFDLSVAIEPDLPGQSIDYDYFVTTPAGRPQFEFLYEGVNPGNSCLTDSPFVSEKTIGALLRGFTETQARYFLARDRQIALACTQDIVVRYYADSLDLRAMLKPLKAARVGKDSIQRFLSRYYHYGLIQATDVNAWIMQKLVVTDSERAMYITAINDFYYFENKIDFGVVPGDKGAETGFDIAANIRNKYGVRHFMSCRADSGNKPRMYWSLDTRLSSIASDSLNYIRFNPFNLAWASRDFARELDLALSNESDQSFTNKRAAADASFRCVIPNPVNLTTPEDNRLRLKPIIHIGLKGYYDYSNNMTAFSSGQGYGKLYYYVPVYSNYSLIVNAMCFYDMSEQRNPGHKVLANYSVTIASEIPGVGFKAIVKFENGVSDIDYKTGKAVTLGLLMDYLAGHTTKSKSSL